MIENGISHSRRKDTLSLFFRSKLAEATAAFNAAHAIG